MDYFRYIIKCILRNIPFKLLFIIAIVLLLSIICFNAKSFAYTEDTFTYHNDLFSLYVSNNAYSKISSLPAFNDSNYDYFITGSNNGDFRVDFWEKNSDIYLYLITYSTLGVSSNSYVPYKSYSYISRTNEIVEISASLNLSTYVNKISSNPNSYDFYGFSSVTIYGNSSRSDIFFRGTNNYYTAPYIVNSTDVDTWSFDNLYISLGSEPYRWTEDCIGYEPTWWELEIIYQDNPYSFRLDNYIYEQDGIDETIFKIPRNVISNSFNLYNGNDITFGLGQYNIHLGNTRFRYYLLDSYTLSLTTAQEEQINNDSEKQVIGNIDNSVTNINNNISNLTDEITNSNVDDFSSDFTDLSTGFEVEDPTSLNEVFMILYNAFCEDDIVNLTFTIPFVNKQVTISSENISARYPLAVTTIVGLFVWGIIGLYVLKDIRSIINKIAEGSPEDVGSDVKKEVL